MTDSIYLRLAGPLQSWAGPAVTGNIVHTERFPTRSALIGLIAGALGARRGDWPEWLNTIEFSVRQDKEPRIVDDFHTINPRPEASQFRRRLLIAERGKARGDKALVFTPDAQGGTSLVNRTYLADGVFVVSVTSREHIDELEDALSSPKFVSYLGRKAFSPTFPYYLGRGASDFIDKLPVVVRSKSQNDAASIKVDKRVYSGNGLGLQRRLSVEVPTVPSLEEQLAVIKENLDIRRVITA